MNLNPDTSYSPTWQLGHHLVPKLQHHPSRAGARCIIQGSVSSAHLNGKRCTLQRVLLGEETHALVEVEVSLGHLGR